MKITTQQALVLFTISQKAMLIPGGFAGYSNEEIMRLCNDIIAQQDNIEIITTEPITIEPIKDTIQEGINISHSTDFEKKEFLKDLHGQKLEKSQKIEEDKYLEDNFNVEKKVKKDDENDENFWN